MWNRMVWPISWFLVLFTLTMSLSFHQSIYCPPKKIRKSLESPKKSFTDCTGFLSLIYSFDFKIFIQVSNHFKKQTLNYNICWYTSKIQYIPLSKKKKRNNWAAYITSLPQKSAGNRSTCLLSKWKKENLHF